MEGNGFSIPILIPCTTSHSHSHSYSQRCSFLFLFPSIFKSDSRSLPRKFPHLIQNSNDSPNQLESWHDTHTWNSPVSPEDVPAYEKKTFYVKAVETETYIHTDKQTDRQGRMNHACWSTKQNKTNKIRDLYHVRAMSSAMYVIWRAMNRLQELERSVHLHQFCRCQS